MKKNILIIIVLSMILQLGCTKKQDMNIDGGNDNLDFIGVVGEDKEIVNRSENIADAVVELFGIDDATAIIFNDSVIVGIALSYDKELSQDTLDAIRTLIRENDSAIEEVYITSDPKLFKQIDNIVVDILQGKPYDKYVANINKIMDKVKKDR